MPNGAQYQNTNRSYAGPWVDQVLQALGAPTTDSNRAALRAWAASEGTLNANNPLAFSGSSPGATTCIAQCGSSSPIMAYSSPQQGAANTAAFILSNSAYASIVAAFRNDAGLQSIYSAINGSPWCAGCQSGSYPTGLSSLVNGKGSIGANPGSSSNSSNSAGGFNPDAPAITVGLGPLKGTLLNAGQELKIKGWVLMIAGGFVAVVGLGIVFGALGLESKAARAVTAFPGARAVRQRRAAEPTFRQRDVERAFDEGTEQGEKFGTSPTQQRRAERRQRRIPHDTVEGVSPQSRAQIRQRQERRERAAQPF